MMKKLTRTVLTRLCLASSAAALAATDDAAIMRGDIMEQSAELGNKDLLYILLG